MYEAELIPNLIPMGVSYKEFWTLTPRTLKVIIEGYKVSRKVDDEKNWYLGGYIFEAVSIAIGNALRKKNQKPNSYFELVQEPYLKNPTNELSEDERQQQIDALMARLSVMQANFNLSHGE